MRSSGTAQAKGRMREGTGFLRTGRGSGIALAAAAGLLIAALAPLAIGHLHEAAWRVSPDERPFMERALAGGAAAFGIRRDEYRRDTRPRVRRLADRICVDLRTAHSGGDGSFFACYDPRGRLLSERAIVCSFGRRRLPDRLLALIW